MFFVCSTLRAYLVGFSSVRKCSHLYNGFPSAEQLLSSDSIHNCIKNLKEVKVRQRELTDDNKKKAAVLIPLCLVDNEMSLLYTLRTSDLKRHRGQVSFPGGMEDSEDKCLEETALRETEEEIGIDRKNISLWGAGNIYVGKEFSVLPVVGFLGDVHPSALKVNPGEVELAFAVALKHFCYPDNRKFTQFRFKKSGYILPAYVNTEYRIWGITALITHIVLSALLPKHYNFKIHYIRPIKGEMKASS
ncbi:nucleoside diphosphate-linked moiety X motif 8 [Cimex lectularius]|uniref:Nudix hydrolase domain-containing protein n=1 Tax=Cimex lectularius TaxID=79782 RepID=A0A8I6SCZ7_CIMLE|nr:nucleoside diphosphate-linked moiety X motif 8 [Cimex lectularius]